MPSGRTGDGASASGGFETLYARIDGICCENCIGIITHALMELNGVDHVDITGNIAEITGPCLPDESLIVEAVRRAGYETSEAAISTRRKDVTSHIRWYEFAGIAAGIVLFALLVKQIFGYNIFNAIPVIDDTMTYGMLFVTGLLTGIHCMGMCGAIGLVASTEMGGERSLKRPLLYNAGRVLSYTVIGAAVGALGSVLSISPAVRAGIILVAAALMLVMALSMLGLFRIRLPRIFSPKVGKLGKLGTGSFVVGLANGLMPCGPLQAMQLYALSTGSALSGALSMCLFALGTVPLMLASGAIINLSRGRAKRIISKIASVLILVLALTMMNRGLLALGVDITALFNREGGKTAPSGVDWGEGVTPAVIHGSTQVVTLELDYDSYGDMVVQVGIPVTVILHADEGRITGCNNEVMCPEFGFDVPLQPGDNIITFTPEAVGTYVYTCWMSMIHNRIIVVDDPALFERESD